MKDTIIGDVLTFQEHPEYKGEYVAKWRGYTVATAVINKNGRVDVTEFHPDQESTRQTEAKSLDAAWLYIKNYTLTDFEDELREYLAPGQGLRR